MTLYEFSSLKLLAFFSFLSTVSRKIAYRSPTVMNFCNPIWTGKEGVNLEFLCDGDLSMPVKVDVFQITDTDSGRSHSNQPIEKCYDHDNDTELVGSFETTFEQLLKKKCSFVCIDSKEMKRKAFELRSYGKKSCGHVMVLDRIKSHND